MKIEDEDRRLKPIIMCFHLVNKKENANNIRNLQQRWQEGDKDESNRS